jgi:hypothetical protein
MLKKSVFVLALVAMMVPATFGRDYLHADGSWTSSATTVSDQPAVNWEYDGANSERKAESWNWPATYDFQDICIIPVRMDVGFWIRVVGCKDLNLDLKQVEIHKYSGSVNVTIQCNVNISLQVAWAKDADISLNGDLMSYSNSVSVSPSTLDAPGGTVTVSLTLSNVDVAGIVKNSSRGVAGGQNCVRVGQVTLRVRPNVKPVLAGGCG